MLTRPALIAGLSSPKMSLAEAWVNVGSPPIGRYSWSSESSSASNFLACKCQHWRVTESPSRIARRDSVLLPALLRGRIDRGMAARAARALESPLS